MARKRKYRVKGLVRQEDLITIFGVMPHVGGSLQYTRTKRDKREEKLVKKGKKPSKTYGKYAHLCITNEDHDLMAIVYETIFPFFVKDYTHEDFTVTADAVFA